MRYCEDAPCCGCCDPRELNYSEPYDPELHAGLAGPDDDDDDSDDVDESMDGDHESALASVYGEDSYLDSYYEDQYDLGD